MKNEENISKNTLLILLENSFQGGDPVIFKKLNDAYYKLIGHIHKAGNNF